MREHLSLLGQFLRGDLRRDLLRCTVGLAVSIALGIAVGLLAPEVLTPAVQAFSDLVEEAGVVDEAGNIFPFALILNNWRAMVLTLCYGSIPFVYLPVLPLASNGFFIGLMAAYYHLAGMPMALYLAALLPHGSLELAALVLSAACGICLCRSITRMITHLPDRIPAVEILSDPIRVLVLVIAPLTVAAAFIECYVTPVIASLFA